MSEMGDEARCPWCDCRVLEGDPIFRWMLAVWHFDCFDLELAKARDRWLEADEVGDIELLVAAPAVLLGEQDDD